MIEYIQGKLADLSPAYAVVDVGGVGYGLNISLNTFSAIEGKETALLWVEESIREDAYTLFGFATKQERVMFQMLLGVSGVGAATARMILSSLSSEELYRVIVDGEERALKQVKGIGVRTAARIIVDLRDKMAALNMLPDTSGIKGGKPQQADNEVRSEAITALTMLGFSPAPSSKVVKEILSEDGTLPVEQVVKLALKRIK